MGAFNLSLERFTKNGENQQKAIKQRVIPLLYFCDFMMVVFQETLVKLVINECYWE